LEFSFNQNNTEIKINYTNQKNESAIITANFVNGTLKNLKLAKNNKKSYWWLLTLMTLPLIFSLLYKKIYKRPQLPEMASQVPKETLPEFDYRKEAKSWLKKSKIFFEKKKNSRKPMLSQDRH
jgi:hypothetical protein